jgi:hypothetical protein
MRRRNFIKGIVGSAAAWPLAARAQQGGKLPTIGLVGPDATVWSPLTATFIARLHELPRQVVVSFMLQLAGT